MIESWAPEQEGWGRTWIDPGGGPYWNWFIDPDLLWVTLRWNLEIGKIAGGGGWDEWKLSTT